jgi:hypothetical protein
MPSYQDLGGIRHQRDTGLVEHVVLPGVHLPPQQGRVGLLDQPGALLAHHQAAVAAAEQYVVAARGAAERGVERDAQSGRVLEHALDRVRHVAAVLPQGRRPVSADGGRRAAEVFSGQVQPVQPGLADQAG